MGSEIQSQVFLEILRPERHVEVIEALHERFQTRGLQWTKEQDGVPFASMRRDASRLASAIVRDLAAGTYEFRPVTIRVAELDKTRALAVPELTDLIVFHVVARVLTERLEPKFPNSLMSFRKGRSAMMAHRRLAAFVREHRSQRLAPRDRGLYILKRDVRSYTDSIDVSESSRLWELLAEQLNEPSPSSPISKLLKSVFRPSRVGEETPPTRGIHAGSPLTPVAANIYLTPLDRALESFSGAFYARFGDDFLFATPSRHVAESALSIIDESLRSLDLEAHTGKRRNLYFNGAGRTAPEAPDHQGVSSFDWLGLRATFAGTFGVSAEKERDLLRDIRERARSALVHVPEASTREAARFVCSVVNQALDPSHPMACVSSGLLRAVSTDLQQLKRLDHAIAAAISQSVTGIRAPRSFRRLSYRTLRHELGLVSLCSERYRPE